MNTQANSFSTFLPVLTGVLLAVTSLSASADEPSRGDVIEYAEVTQVVPLYRQVTVEVPVRECFENRGYSGQQQRNRNGRSSVPGMIVGGIVGGIIGNQFGRGHGNDAATIAGTLIGAGIGSNATSRRAAVPYPATTCTTRYEMRTEQRADGYRVTYEYDGKLYSTRTHKLPGQQIPVRVSVRPAF